MGNYKANRKPHIDEILYICPLWRCWGVYYTQTSTNMLQPTFHKTVATFWTILSKCLLLLGKFLKASGKEKEERKNQNWIHESQAIPGEACSPPTTTYFFFFNKQISSEAIWHYLVWNIISSSLRHTPLSSWCIFLTEPSLLGLLYHKSHCIIFDNLY